ncbi:esterase E4-like [Leptidea sinapis]|uniref:esterase E4-like n=1 Tax=Leptidea sinapis TaxID=189913 RepID=UPI00213391BB|nr:esterase E4-like [Leptidea sinapis]
MRLSVIIFCIFIRDVFTEEEEKIVILESGGVSGEKYWNGDFYEFYGIPYATNPKGRNKFKAPLPVTPWEGIISTSKNTNLCHQSYYTDNSDDEAILAGDEECLTVNVLTPLSASEEDPVPVIVYVHSGAFSGGSGNMAKFNYLARHDVVVVSFNYRVGAFGFACLGNEDIPGNAGLKDQLAALQWIKTNIKKFGGDPDKITLAGFSVGASMAELLALNPKTDGLINQLILESGSALSPFTINRDPFSTAWNIALSLGYNGTESLEDLTEFYLNVDEKALAIKSVNYFLTNSTFGFAPCIENIQDGIEPFLTESPLDTLVKGNFKKIPVITGFSNMEGISRSIKFGTWRDMMNENFEDFLPADLQFNTEQEKNEAIREIKHYYFNNKNITHESLRNYVDYFSDSMFKYWILKSAYLHASASENPLYLYEFSYVGNLNIQHHYMDRLKGASHRDQTAYILDFYGYTNSYRDLDTRERMTTMWTDFTKYGNPTKFESSIITVKWPPFTKDSPKYLEISKRLHIKENLLKDSFMFWDKIYKKYYWNPKFTKYDPQKFVRQNNNDENENGKNDDSKTTNKINVKTDNLSLIEKNETKSKDASKEEKKQAEHSVNNGKHGEKIMDAKDKIKKTKIITNLDEGGKLEENNDLNPSKKENALPKTKESKETVNKIENKPAQKYNNNDHIKINDETKVKAEDKILQQNNDKSDMKVTRTTRKLDSTGKLVNQVEEKPSANEKEPSFLSKEQSKEKI